VLRPAQALQQRDHPGVRRLHLARAGKTLKPHSLSGTIADGTLTCLARFHLIPTRQDLMSAKNSEIAESAFEKYQRREAEIASALRQEQARHEAVIRNMQRLRSLRLQREAQRPPPAKSKSAQTKSRQTA
jgi:hypothetical protein